MAETYKKIDGKKIFFLYPHSVVQDKMLRELICNGYEAYILRDHEKAIKLLEKDNNSILFINIDEVLQKPDWEQYVKFIIENPITKNVRIGILTYNADNTIAEKYLMQMKVPCGFTVLKLRFTESLDIILKILEFNEAKGRRQHIRAICNDIYKASFNLEIQNKTYSGAVRDISIAGMACSFDSNVKLEVGTHLNHIQLRLKGVICISSGKITFIRADEVNFYIIMFDDKISFKDRERIYNFVYNSLQYNIEQEIKKIE